MMLLLYSLMALVFTPLPSSDITLCYTRPASDWSEALVVTNGRLGATTFGGVGEDCVQINDDFRRQPLADLLLTFDHVGDASRYARWWDRDRAVATVRYSAGDVTYTRETMATATDDVIAVRVETGRRGTLSFEAALASPHMHSVKCPRFNHVMLQGEMEEAGILLETWLVVLAEGGTVTSGEGKIVVEGADAATLIIAAGVGDDRTYVCRKTMGAAVRKSYSQLLQDRSGGGSIKPD